MQKHYISAGTHFIEKTSFKLYLTEPSLVLSLKEREENRSHRDILEDSKILTTYLDSENTFLAEWKLYLLESKITNDESSVDIY